MSSVLLQGRMAAAATKTLLLAPWPFQRMKFSLFLWALGCSERWPWTWETASVQTTPLPSPSHNTKNKFPLFSPFCAFIKKRKEIYTDCQMCVSYWYYFVNINNNGFKVHPPQGFPTFWPWRATSKGQSWVAGHIKVVHRTLTHLGSYIRSKLHFENLTFHVLKFHSLQCILRPPFHISENQTCSCKGIYSECISPMRSLNVSLQSTWIGNIGERNISCSAGQADSTST